MNEELRQRWRWVLGAVALLSLLFRASYALELWSSPVMVAHRFHGSDMEFFDRWARALSAGDWWTRQELHPFAPWQRAFATEYLDAYPEEKAALLAGGVPDGEVSLGRALWSRWYGGRRLHQEPLYPYLVGLSYRLFGPDPRYVFLWQLLLGAATNVLIAMAARRAFGPLAGAAAGLLAVFCAPLLSQEMVLLRTTLSAFTITLAALLLERAFQDGGARRHLAAGLALGLTLLCQLPMALVAGAAFLLTAWRARGRAGAALREGAALALGAALPLLPVVVRNGVVGVAPLTYVSVGTQTYLPHAVAWYDPHSGARAITRAELPIMRESGGAFGPAARLAWKTHRSWPARLRFYAGKLAAAVSWYEETDNQSLYYLRLVSPTLRRLPLTFAAVGPLAAAGLAAFLLRRSPRGAVLVAIALTGVVVCVLTIPISRYRAPYLPGMLCLAGAAVAAAVEAVQERRWGALGVVGAAGALGAVAVLQPLPPGKPLLRPVDWSSPYLYSYGPEAEAAARAGRWGAAAELLDEFLQLRPPELMEMTRRISPTRGERDLVCFYADVTRFQAVVLGKAQREGGVAPDLREALDSACLRFGATPR